jgi:hypothetical protein
VDFEQFIKLSAKEMAAAMKEPLAKALEERKRLQNSTPRLARFASTFATTGPWIDFGLKFAATKEVLLWSASAESWKQALVSNGFFGAAILEPVIGMASSFGKLFDEQQIERVVIWSKFGAAAALSTYEMWKADLVQSLGPPDIARPVDQSYLALPRSELLIWDSPIARASLVISDCKDSPVAEFRLRHKLIAHLEKERAAFVATGNYEKFDR